MIERRKFLKNAFVGTGLSLLATPFAKALAESCGVTPAQTEGPFYPGKEEFSHSSDLTQISGRPRAQGEIIELKGRVIGSDCLPVEGASVEIWQACASGKYQNSKDPNPAPLDPNFRYWAEVFTDSKGNYSFRTIRPGAYPANAHWIRPPHIHFKISRLGYRELTTQLYFSDEKLNDQDLILNELSAEERKSVIVSFENQKPGFFEITLQKVAWSRF